MASEWPPLIRHPNVSALHQGQEVYLVTTVSRKICIRRQRVDSVFPEMVRFQEPACEVSNQDLQMGTDNACKQIIFTLAARPESAYFVSQKLSDVKVGDAITVFAKVLHAQDPTQLLLKQLSGTVTCIKGCITFGTHSIYEENMKLEKDSDRQWNTDLLAFRCSKP